METYMELCPFRAGCDMQKIYAVLARSQKPLALPAIAKKSHINFGTTQRMVAAMRNDFHNAPMRRIGVSVVHGKDGYSLERVKPQPKATRPPRGKPAKKAKPKAKRKPAGKKESIRKAPVTAPVVEVPAPVDPATSVSN